MWALGNIAGDSPKCRDLVLSYGALHPLLEQLRDNTKMSMLRNATWTLSNFCRGKPQPDFDQVRAARPRLQRRGVAARGGGRPGPWGLGASGGNGCRRHSNLAWNLRTG